MSKNYIIGVDAGGTKTEIVLCDCDGNVIRRALRGTGNPNDIGITACAALIADGIGELCGEDNPAAVFAGVSGAGVGSNGEGIKTLLKKSFPKSKIEVGTDASNLLASGRGTDDLSALICGTGTALFVSCGGKEYRIGGWGCLFDDGGSAYDLGREAIRLLLGAEENLWSYGKLCELLSSALGGSAHDGLAEVYAKGKAYIASFAPLVFEAAAQGDAQAESIVEKSAEAVCRRLDYARKLYRAGGELVCGGGLFNSSAFSELISEKAEKIGFQTYIPKLPQSYGACVKARNLVSTLDQSEKNEFEVLFYKGYEKYL